MVGQNHKDVPGIKEKYKKDMVEVTRCKDCRYYISDHDMKIFKDEYKDYKNKLDADGLCRSTDKWTDEDDFCSCAKKRRIKK